MGFWIIGIGLALLCAAVLVRAGLRARTEGEPPAAYDLRVYRDQLKEVDRDLARGVISEEDAERVRTEVSRRILAADAQVQAAKEGRAQPRSAGYGLAGLAAVVVLVGSVLIYGQLGAPGYGDLPLAQRIAQSDAARDARLSQADAEARVPAAPPEDQRNIDPSYLDLITKLRQAVADRPDDPEGLTLLVRHEAGLGNSAAAHAAQARLITVKGDAATGEDYASLADLMVTAAGGYVSVEAEAALRDALSRSSDHPVARYYLGLYMLQIDRPDTAFRLWKQLLETSGPTDPWTASLITRLPEVAARAGVKYDLPQLAEAPGPSADDVDAAAELSPEERAEMIQGMVARLSARLASQGGTAEEWARLIAAYGVLGDTDQAQAIYNEALQVFANDPAALDAMRAAGERAGVVE